MDARERRGIGEPPSFLGEPCESLGGAAWNRSRIRFRTLAFDAD